MNNCMNLNVNKLNEYDILKIFTLSLFSLFSRILSLHEEYNQRFGLKSSLMLVDLQMQTGELFTLQWNAESDIQALKSLDKFLTFQYWQKAHIINKWIVLSLSLLKRQRENL